MSVERTLSSRHGARLTTRYSDGMRLGVPIASPVARIGESSLQPGRNRNGTEAETAGTLPF